MNVLLITDHFIQYAKAVVTSNQSTRVTVTAFWNECIANYGFLEKLLMDQGCNFNLKWLRICANWLTYTKCEPCLTTPKLMASVRFKQTHINMISTLESTNKQHWKDYLPTLVHAYNCTNNSATDFSPTIWCTDTIYVWPIYIKFGLTTSKTEEDWHNEFVAKLNTQLTEVPWASQ